MNNPMNRTLAAIFGSVLWLIGAALIAFMASQFGDPTSAALIVVGAGCLCAGTWVSTVAKAVRESGERHVKQRQVPYYLETLPRTQQIAALVIPLGLGFASRGYVSEYFRHFIGSMGVAGGVAAGLLALGGAAAIVGLILYGLFKWLDLFTESPA